MTKDRTEQLRKAALAGLKLGPAQFLAQGLLGALNELEIWKQAFKLIYENKK